MSKKGQDVYCNGLSQHLWVLPDTHTMHVDPETCSRKL